MKKISILIPCFNEKLNIQAMTEALTRIMIGYEGKYDYEIVYRDNASTDGSLDVLRDLAYKDKHIKVIENARNYGMTPLKNSYIGRVHGDVVISIPCDFQEPPELIPEFILWWEKGYEAVCGQKISSKEGKVKYALRQVFYDIIDKFSEVKQYRNVSGITLMSKHLYDLFEKYCDIPLRFFLADIGCEVKLIQYEQQKRRTGKSSYNIWRYLSFAVYSLTSVSTTPLRIASVLGFIMSFMSFLAGFVYLIFKLIWWNRFVAGTAPMLIGVFFLGSIQMFFIGVVGEYVGITLRKVSRSSPPLVKELINFDNPDDDPYLFKSEIHEDIHAGSDE